MAKRGRKPKQSQDEIPTYEVQEIPPDIADAIRQWERTHDDELAKYFNRDSDE